MDRFSFGLSAEEGLLWQRKVGGRVQGAGSRQKGAGETRRESKGSQDIWKYTECVL